MKILWVCNVVLPNVAEQFGMESTNKEGWLSGLAEALLRGTRDSEFELALAFPLQHIDNMDESEVLEREATLWDNNVKCYGFLENTGTPEYYDAKLEDRLRIIFDRYKPDVVHCFGTEFPHTLAACRAAEDKRKVLIGIQGLCAPYADAYYADLPDEVIHSVTFRDIVRRDTLPMQHEKFVKRGQNEIAAIKLAGNITGRTAWDLFYATEWNPDAQYFKMNESLRADFYRTKWNEADCEPYSIFMSQGDYPIKGLHYMLAAMGRLKEKYPDIKLYLAGNNLTDCSDIKKRIKLSAYGKYLRKLIRSNGLEGRVVFRGRLSGEQMLEQYLKSNLYVCCSSIENSPNSLGEAMLLGMPCVSADVGGIPSIFEDGMDGILFKGFRDIDNAYYNRCYCNENSDNGFENVVKSMVAAIDKMWSEKNKTQIYCQNARKHATKTHDKAVNSARMKEIYSEIYAKTH